MSTSLSIEQVEACDILYVSPHAEDAALSCPGGLLSAADSGQKVLMATLFGPTEDPPEAVVRLRERLGAGHLAFKLPDAVARNPAYSTFEDVLFGRQAEDDAIVAEASELLAETARRAQPRAVYAPLGVWGHVDHRLAHDAASACFEAGSGRDVFFYEERPFGLLPSAVKIRLAQLGARLPPVAAAAQDAGGVARFAASFLSDTYVRRHFTSFRDGLRCTRLAVRQWRESRTWRPLKAFGLRLQPVLQAVPGAALELLKETCEGFPNGSPFGSPIRLQKLVDRHARRLRQGTPVERYWLLLPSTGEVVVS